MSVHLLHQMSSQEWGELSMLAAKASVVQVAIAQIARRQGRQELFFDLCDGIEVFRMAVIEAQIMAAATSESA